MAPGRLSIRYNTLTRESGGTRGGAAKVVVHPHFDNWVFMRRCPQASDPAQR
ncbi:hypothetical protein GCM10010289_84370 [Streptomyces violascens]|nr:hypothetical protein GCM10010289_84370 [Streptomyces violascens]